MQKTNLIRGGRRSLLTLLAVAATSFVGVNLHAQSDSSASQLLASSLPQGVSLKTASDAQMVEAVRTAVTRDPKMAEGIVRVAIVTKVPASERKGTLRRAPSRRSRPRGDGKSTSQTTTYNPWAVAGVSDARPFVFIAVNTSDPEGYIAAVVAAAAAAAPEQVANIVAAAVAAAPAFAVSITQTAISLAPQYTSQIIGAASGAAPEYASEIAALGGGDNGDNGGGGGNDNQVGSPSFPSSGGGGGTGGSDLTVQVTNVTGQ
jgi:hypothetical protein